MIKKLRNISLSTGLILLTGMIMVPTVAAQNSTFQLSPTKSIIAANPGEKKQVAVTIKNITTSTQNYAVSFDNFTASEDESGNPKIITDPAFPRGIHTWLKGATTLSVAPGALRDYTATLTVPTGTKTGSYYGFVRFGPDTTSAGVGSLVIVNVGPISQEVAIKDLDTSAVKVDSLGNVTGKLAARLVNPGNGYVVPLVKIEILDDKKAVVETIDANPGQGGLLPDGSVRRYEAAITKQLEPSKTYSARLTATAGNNKPVTIEKTFVEAPAANTPAATGNPLPSAKKKSILPLVAVGAAALLLLAAVVAIILKKRRKSAPAPVGVEQPAAAEVAATPALPSTDPVGAPTEQPASPSDDPPVTKININ